MTDDDLLHSRYRLVEVLGQGAMGVVWRAHDSVLDREIALKELRPAEGVDVDEAKERFLVEARAAARLTHPNIVGIHDVFSDDDRVLIAMELVEGPTLDELVRSGAQEPSVVREVMAQVAQALAIAHGQGVVHRDLKPDNIFWNGNRAVVGDFGLARIGAGRGTIEGTVMGTPGYMSPEQVKGSPTGPQTDVFGWAAVAYQLVAGIPPFGEPLESDITAMAYRVVHQDPPPLDLPGDPALAALITKALAKDPTQRPADGAALVAGLMEATGPSHQTRSTGPHQRPGQSSLRPIPKKASFGSPDSTQSLPFQSAKEASLPTRPLPRRGIIASNEYGSGARTGKSSVLVTLLVLVPMLGATALVAGLLVQSLLVLHASPIFWMGFLGCGLGLVTIARRRLHDPTSQHCDERHDM